MPEKCYKYISSQLWCYALAIFSTPQTRNDRSANRHPAIFVINEIMIPSIGMFRTTLSNWVTGFYLVRVSPNQNAQTVPYLPTGYHNTQHLPVITFKPPPAASCVNSWVGNFSSCANHNLNCHYKSTVW